MDFGGDGIRNGKRAGRFLPLFETEDVSATKSTERITKRGRRNLKTN